MNGRVGVVEVLPVNAALKGTQVGGEDQPIVLDLEPRGLEELPSDRTAIGHVLVRRVSGKPVPLTQRGWQLQPEAIFRRCQLFLRARPRFRDREGESAFDHREHAAPSRGAYQKVEGEEHARPLRGAVGGFQGLVVARIRARLALEFLQLAIHSARKAP